MKSFSRDKVTLLHGDCMDYMKDIPDNHFDLAIVDPPYGIGEDGGKNRRGESKHKKKSWDNEKPNDYYFKELFRISKNQIIWGGNYFVNNLFPSMGWICWDKKLYNSDFSDFELAWTSFQRAAKIFMYAKNGGSRTAAALADIIHPTQKPVQLYKWLLKNYAEKDFKILDTHLGSGSSAIASYYFGCEFTGIEIDEEYFNSAVKRFDHETRQQTLF